MSERKQTPDILGELLGQNGEVDPGGGLVLPLQKPKARSRAKPAAKSVKQPVLGKVIQQKKECWEYRVVSFQNHYGWRPRFVDGQEAPDWMSAPLMPEYLHHMGDEGWQLAASASGESMFACMDKYQLFFMRKKD